MKHKKKKILLAPNSFKESSDSVRISNMLSENLTDLEGYELLINPISDGGDGFLNVCKYYFGGEELHYKISSPYSRDKINCPVLYCESKKTIYIESAEVLGSKIIPIKYRNPLLLTSKGLGELLRVLETDSKKKKLNVNDVIIGIGGTGTIDMGIGACSVFGMNLYDEKDERLEPIPLNFSIVSMFDWGGEKLPFKFQCVIDVSNPLLGKKGAVRVFGEQKGASKSDENIMEDGFTNLVKLFQNNKLLISTKELSGAGGGIPSGLRIFFGSEYITAQNFIFKNLQLERYSDSADYLITGEGAFDEQSFMGKGAGSILEQFSNTCEKIFLVCGIITRSVGKKLPKNIIPIELRKFFETKEEAIKNLKRGIECACNVIKSYL
ncbi:MAG: glycerate kinase [Promethearchaeota archaeon]|jgi:glycerate kinase